MECSNRQEEDQKMQQKERTIYTQEEGMKTNCRDTDVRPVSFLS